MTTNPPPELADYLYITAAVTEKTAAEKGELLTAYCRGLALALRAIHAEPTAFKEWSRGFLGGMEPALFEASFANNLGIYMRDPVPTPAHFALNLEFLKDELRLVNQPPPPDSFGFEEAWDLRFARQAMQGL